MMMSLQRFRISLTQLFMLVVLIGLVMGIPVSMSRSKDDHFSGVHSVAFSANGELLAAGYDDGIVRIWDVSEHRLISVFHALSDDHCIVVFSPDQKTLAVAALSVVELWDTRTWKRIGKLEGHQVDVASLAYSPDGRYLAVGSERVLIWDTAHEVVPPKIGLLLQMDSYLPIRCLQFSADSQSIFVPIHKRGPAGFLDSVTHVTKFNVATGQELLVVCKHDVQTDAIALAPTGDTLVTGSDDGRVVTWDAQTGYEILPLLPHNELGSGFDLDHVIRSVGYSADGAAIATTMTEDRTVRLWDAKSGRELATLRGHLDTVTSLTFSPHNNLIASASIDRMVRLWDWRAGRQVAVLPDPQQSLPFNLTPWFVVALFTWSFVWRFQHRICHS